MPHCIQCLAVHPTNTGLVLQYSTNNYTTDTRMAVQCSTHNNAIDFQLTFNPHFNDHEVRKVMNIPQPFSIPQPHPLHPPTLLIHPPHPCCSFAALTHHKTLVHPLHAPIKHFFTHYIHPLKTTSTHIASNHFSLSLFSPTIPPIHLNDETCQTPHIIK